MRKFAVAASIISWVFSIPSEAYISKGSPSIAIKVSRDGINIYAVATLNGELKGSTWMCPLPVWGCYNIEGTRVSLSNNWSVIDAECQRSEPQRTFEWTSTVHESCQVQLHLEPRNGKRPLIGKGPEPLEWHK